VVVPVVREALVQVLAVDRQDAGVTLRSRPGWFAAVNSSVDVPMSGPTACGRVSSKASTACATNSPIVEEATQTFLRFRDAVETRFASTRRLEDYARTLGYSTRTLSRASMDAGGVGAKEYIDRRVLLEAKRLLAHGDQPAAKIAIRLGFSSATNFSKFFRQRTGMTPLAFRQAVRGTAI
jgi:AraC-like DNA-binding protein